MGDRRRRVLSAVLNQTIRYQRVLAPVSRTRMAFLSDLPETSVGALLKDLEVLGFLVYSPGTGRRLGTVRIIIPDGWNEHEQSLMATRSSIEG